MQACHVIIHEKIITTVMKPHIGLPTSQALFSPERGIIWARLYSPDAPDHWTIEYAPDEEDLPRNPHHVPGSLIWMYQDVAPDWFDQVLLEREFRLHIKYLRRFKWRNEATDQKQ